MKKKLANLLRRFDHLLQARQFRLENLLPLISLLYVLVEPVQIHRGNLGAGSAHSDGLTGFGLTAIGQEQLQSGHYATMCLTARVLHDVHSELHDIARADLVRFRLGARLTEADVVDEGAIATTGILRVGILVSNVMSFWNKPGGLP